MLLDPVVLGVLFRHLQHWQSLYEAEGIDSLTGPDGEVYCLADLLRLHELSRHLEPLQARAIACLYKDMTDAEAAQELGVDGVSELALSGLVLLCELFYEYRPFGDDDEHAGSPAGGPAAPPGQEQAPERDLPCPGGVRGLADSRVLAGRDLALCQV